MDREAQDSRHTRVDRAGRRLHPGLLVLLFVAIAPAVVAALTMEHSRSHGDETASLAATRDGSVATPHVTGAGATEAAPERSRKAGETQRVSPTIDGGGGAEGDRDGPVMPRKRGAAPVPAGEIDRIVARLVAERRFVDLHADTILRAARRRQDLSAEYAGAEVDIPKMRRAGMGLMFFAVCSPRPRLRPGFRTWQDFAFIRYFKHVLATHDALEQAYGAADARRIRAEGKIPVVLSLEGAGILLNDPARLQTLYDAGMRAIGPVWNITNTLADAARDTPKWGGLSPVGRQAVLEMNRLGIMVDVSHASEEAFWDIIETSRSPVYASHSNAYALRAHPRNLKDDQIRAIARGGGVIGVAFHRTFLKRGRGPATIDDVVAHVRHIADVGGIGCVAIGTDFGGGAILPAGLSNIGALPDLVRALLEAGFSEQDVRAIMGGNAMRYFATICP